MTNKVLIVAAHPDDEILGCGGTMARHVQEGDNVDILYISDGVTARNREHTSEEIAERNAAAHAAAKIVGANAPTFGTFQDQRLDTSPLIEIVRLIEGTISRVRPNIIYTHHFGDLNLDHAITHRAVMTATRPQPGTQIAFVYAFECLSSTEWNIEGAAHDFTPNYFVDISSSIKTKMDALQAYKVEMRPAPHARSFDNVQNLARLRGSSVGVAAAEAFRLIRGVRLGN